MTNTTNAAAQPAPLTFRRSPAAADRMMRRQLGLPAEPYRAPKPAAKR